jgi:hypothetical protein
MARGRTDLEGRRRVAALPVDMGQMNRRRAHKIALALRVDQDSVLAELRTHRSGAI